MSLVAVFFSLGIGLFLGISLGENILVSNQIEVIERMEIKINSYQRRIKELEEKILSLQKDQESYAMLEDKLYPIILQDILLGHKIAFITHTILPDNVLSFFDISGSELNIYLKEVLEEDFFYNEEFWADYSVLLVSNQLRADLDIEGPYVFTFFIDEEGKLFLQEEKEPISFASLYDCLTFLELIGVNFVN